MKTGVAIAIAIAVGGFAVGRWSGGGTVEQGERATTVVRDRLVTAPQSGVSASEVRALLRDELAAAHVAGKESSSSGPSKTADEPTEPREPSPGAAPANALVETAIGRGLWTIEDGHQLQTLVAQLDRSEVRALLRRITQAVNNQQLKIEATNGALM